MIRVGVVGGTGYTGVELLRLLLRHPGVKVSLITSRGEAGRRLDNLFPSLLGACDLAFTDPAEADYSACDLVFFATPHNVAMSVESLPSVLSLASTKNQFLSIVSIEGVIVLFIYKCYQNKFN